jgi:hypothetical protein
VPPVHRHLGTQRGGCSLARRQQHYSVAQHLLPPPPQHKHAHTLQVYLAGASSPRANLVLLDHILSTRHELARLLGFDSYAAFKAADDTLAGDSVVRGSHMRAHARTQCVQCVVARSLSLHLGPTQPVLSIAATGVCARACCRRSRSRRGLPAGSHAGLQAAGGCRGGGAHAAQAGPHERRRCGAPHTLGTAAAHTCA